MLSHLEMLLFCTKNLLTVDGFPKNSWLAKQNQMKVTFKLTYETFNNKQFLKCSNEKKSSFDSEGRIPVSTSLFSYENGAVCIRFECTFPSKMIKRCSDALFKSR